MKLMRTLIFGLIAVLWLIGAFYYSATVEIHNGSLVYTTYSKWGKQVDALSVVPTDGITDFKVMSYKPQSARRTSYYVRLLTSDRELDMKYIRFGNPFNNKKAIRFCNEIKDACVNGTEFRHFSVKHKIMFWLSGMFFVVCILSFISDYFHLGD